MGLKPGKMVSLAWKLSMIDKRLKEQNYFGEKITGSKVIYQKLPSVPSLCEDAEFRNNVVSSLIFIVTYQIVILVISFRSMKYDRKYKHLSNIAAVAMRVLSFI
jgi:hypothetical protein